MNTLKHTPRVPELVYDSKGINGPDEYRTRVATFTSDTYAKEYGHKLAAAPAMYDALVETMKVLRSLRDNKEEWYTLVTPELLTAWDKNKAALAQAEGRDK